MSEKIDNSKCEKVPLIFEYKFENKGTAFSRVIRHPANISGCRRRRFSSKPSNNK